MSSTPPKRKLPKADARLAVKAWWDGAAKEDERTLLIEFDAGQAGTDADFFRAAVRVV